MFLGKIKPTLFHKKERIVRHIYSPYSFNDKTNQLRPNFLQFVFQDESQKNELSSTRFEVETLNHCRIVGKHHSDPSKKRVVSQFGIT